MFSQFTCRALARAACSMLFVAAGAAGAANTLVTVDPVPPDFSQVGKDASIAVPADGRPVISYYDESNSNLKFVKCGNAACTSGNVVRTLDANGNVGSTTAIAIGGDGLPVIAYYSSSFQYLLLGKCATADCGSFSAGIIENVGITGGRLSMAIGTDGFPVIAYHYSFSGTSGLKVARCTSANCATGTLAMIDSSSSAGAYDNSVAIGPDGFPVIAYSTASPFHLRVAKCSSANCLSAVTVTTVDGTTNAGSHNAIAIGAGGLPVIAYYDATNMYLKLARCGNSSCSSGNTFSLVDTVSGKYVSLAVPADGLPVMSYFEEASRVLKVAKCGDAGCSTAARTVVDWGLTVPSSNAETGWWTSLAIGANGLPVVAYQDWAAHVLRVAGCGSASCGSTSTLSVARSGTGTGTVTSTPAGINCGATCSASFAAGTVVTLSAAPDATSTFAGWSGACTGAGTCQVTMDAARSVTATFTRINYGLTAAKAGSGGGTLTSAPSGIDCGATCSASFAAGTVVTLSAAPDATSTFAGWSGACTGTGTCQVTMDAARSVTATFTLPTSIPRLGNISTRGRVETGNDVMIGGFIVGGSTPKKVLITARGPSLTAFGVTGAMANPTLQLYSGQTLIASNDDWQTNTNAAEITASGIAPTSPLESALLMTLNPGAYTAIVSGAGGGMGVGIVEVFEMDRPDIPLINISTRGQVQTGDNVMIGGFIIYGDTPKTVLITARGPSLAPFGITNPLANPSLQLFSGQTMIASNDDWQTNTNVTVIQATGVAPTNALESAILVTLNPGAYTAIVSGVGGGTGVGIVEVFAQ